MLLPIILSLVLPVFATDSPVKDGQTLAKRSDPAPSEDKGPRLVLFVKDEVTLIEMPSLQVDATSPGIYSIGARFTAMDSFGGRQDDLGRNLGDPANADFNEEPFTAMQVYGFKVQPGEALKLNLDCDVSGKVVMSFYIPKDPSMMLSQLRWANGTPRPLRSRHIELTNITKSPYEAILILKGQPNFPYRITVERVPGKTELKK